MTRQDYFIKAVTGMAIQIYFIHDILPSLTISQACLESDYGISDIQNNIYGIKKGTGWSGETVKKTTKEFINGQWITVDEYFRAYDNIYDSMDDYAQVLLQKRYDTVRAAKDYVTATNAVHKCGYATDPAYPVKLQNIITTYHLDVLDKIQPSDTGVQAVQHLADSGILNDRERWSNLVEMDVIKYLDKIMIVWDNMYKIVSQYNGDTPI